jgi:uncharacterized protein (TIGR02996 family)
MTTTNEEAFLSALRDDPNDELTWWALADWLDDSGQGERAELLRLLSRARTKPLSEHCADSARAAELLAAGVEPVRLEFTNSIGMRFVLVWPGRFLMGSPPDEEGRSGDEQRHEVTITKAFWLGVFPVTQGQWKAVMGSNPSYFRRDGGGKSSVRNASDADLDQSPVELVSWEHAQDFLKKLAALPEEVKGRREYRLPSEAEWEYACRGGPVSSALPFHLDRPSSSLSSTQANFHGDYPCGGAARGPSLQRPCKVGSYKPNRLGLFDMHGNVDEWCLDWYDADSYVSSPPADPPGPASGSVRVFRGGSCFSRGAHCRAAHRGRLEPSDRLNDLGFRAAAVPHE